jgi:hypothetical protein
MSENPSLLKRRDRVREPQKPLSPAGGSDEPTGEGGSEGMVRGLQDAL